VLGVPRGTLADWLCRWKDPRDRLRAAALGRGGRRPSPEVRKAIRVLVWTIGPGVGIARIQAAFPHESRRAVERIVRSFRRAFTRKCDYTMGKLRWHRPGAVWAMDYTKPPRPIEDTYPWILVVRDLASGNQLLSLAVREATAKTTVRALRSLFNEHGPPLVLKADNGGHFTAHDVRALLDEHHVLLLLSPPRTPTYNGSIEAGARALKDQTRWVARRNARPDAWTRNDVEEARLLANLTCRPRFLRGATPDQAWAARVPIGYSERAAFGARTAEIEAELRASGLDPGAAARQAIRRTLDEWGILEVRRRRVRLSKRQLMRLNFP